jgi:hypothetical protein
MTICGLCNGRVDEDWHNPSHMDGHRECSLLHPGCAFNFSTDTGTCFACNERVRRVYHGYFVTQEEQVDIQTQAEEPIETQAEELDVRRYDYKEVGKTLLYFGMLPVMHIIFGGARLFSMGYNALSDKMCPRRD